MYCFLYYQRSSHREVSTPEIPFSHPQLRTADLNHAVLLKIAHVKLKTLNRDNEPNNDMMTALTTARIRKIIGEQHDARGLLLEQQH